MPRCTAPEAHQRSEQEDVLAPGHRAGCVPQEDC